MVRLSPSDRLTLNPLYIPVFEAILTTFRILRKDCRYYLGAGLAGR